MDTDNLFNEKVGHRIYSSIMSLNHFKFIKRRITFDDSTTPNDRWKKDKFSAFREVFELFERKPYTRGFSKHFLPPVNGVKKLNLN